MKRAAFSRVVGIIELTVVHAGPAEPRWADDQNLEQTLARLVAECSAAPATRPSCRRWRWARRSMTQSISTPVETILAHRARLESELVHETQALLAQLGNRPSA